MLSIKEKTQARQHRHTRIRKKIIGTPEKPRLAVFRSHRHIYAQIIDDLAGRTLVSASTRGQDFQGALNKGGNLEASQKVGALLAKKAITVGIQKVVFDRGGYLFHGRIKALAEAARQGGLHF